MILQSKTPKDPPRLRTRKNNNKKMGEALLPGNTYRLLDFFFGSSFAMDMRSMM